MMCLHLSYMFIKIEWHERKKMVWKLGDVHSLKYRTETGHQTKINLINLNKWTSCDTWPTTKGLLSLFPTSGGEPIKAQQVGGTSVPPCPQRPLRVGIWRQRLVERQPKLKQLLVYFCKHVFLCIYVCVFAFFQIANSLLAFHSSPRRSPSLCSQGPIFSQAP